MKIERKNILSKEQFENEYLTSNRPVIITDAMNNWSALRDWTPDYLEEHFGNEEVQIYDDLFNLIDVILLNKYIKKYFKQKDFLSSQIIPYARWYTRLKDHDFAWADHFFEKIKTHWDFPYFLPKNNYLLPYCPSSQTINPVEENFPAKGIFISPKGAKTSLHYDPWCSDAVLCQIYGEKDIILYPPEQKSYLCNNGNFVNIDKPNLQHFPNFHNATPTFIDSLNPGEIIFLPHGWIHQVNTVSDSISLTWNFVHISTWKPFFDYLTENKLTLHEKEVLQFFLKS